MQGRRRKKYTKVNIGQNISLEIRSESPNRHEGPYRENKNYINN